MECENEDFANGVIEDFGGVVGFARVHVAIDFDHGVPRCLAIFISTVSMQGAETKTLPT